MNFSATLLPWSSRRAIASIRRDAARGRWVKLFNLVRQLAPLLRQIEIHQSRFQRDRETAGPFTVLRSLTAFLCSIDHTQQKRAARSGSSAHHFTSYQSACALHA
jgi:hypothetical protein